MSTLLQQLANGVVQGALIALIALGYTMVYGIIQLINFAHGEVFMVGAYGGLATYTWIVPESVKDVWYVSLPIVLVGGVAVSVAIALLMERFAYRPLRNAPRLAPLITALGVSVFLQEFVRNFYPNATAALPFPGVFVQGQLVIGPIRVGWSGILLIGVSVLLSIALQTYINRSRMGRAMRATAQDPDTAKLMGVNPDRVIVLTFVLGAALAGVAGVLFGTYLNNINTDMGFQTGIFAFTAAVLGGVGSIRGAVVGAFIIGLVKTLAGQYMPGGTQYDYVWIFVVLILVLVFRPQGLFGEPERVRA
ncbi:branched-chain amino acid ABC transporter permease [Umezawaea tangerina]|uniref:Amino acid/amide ABC transporter membrane protein 1 (HAAT family) n=1 Tax=Umezawaea tangerina TaxID=84725 RepID=A0A2T0T9I6_9PSEU|nr:branched-chain amino acid ABC transporter permease [Umezawaea tangerina]PRY42322.1 amino acid/amide ABC transporter membrane protein 1 (HAAT family) [Umezawaea tangerina]